MYYGTGTSRNTPARSRTGVSVPAKRPVTGAYPFVRQGYFMLKRIQKKNIWLRGTGSTSPQGSPAGVGPACCRICRLDGFDPDSAPWPLRDTKTVWGMGGFYRSHSRKKIYFFLFPKAWSVAGIFRDRFADSCFFLCFPLPPPSPCGCCPLAFCGVLPDLRIYQHLPDAVREPKASPIPLDTGGCIGAGREHRLQGLGRSLINQPTGILQRKPAIATARL